ncbi:MAG TPA: hypothetical protein VNX21_00850 [Candidatus Thermoplasmatota archaeon]|nr:hypothetical protein [Candidatus Thermoplasmatota archaeon]
MPHPKSGPKSGTSTIAGGDASGEVDETELKEGQRRKGGQDVQ